MNKKFYLPLLLALVFAFTGCKNMGELSPEYFTANPSPLEAIGGEVPVTITGSFPEKYFNKNAIVTVTPYLVYEGGETAGTPYIYEGEKVQGNNQKISYKAGGNITMKTTFKYIPEMRKSELFLAFSVFQGSKTYEIPRVKIAEGVLSTSEISSVESVTPAIANDKFQRIIQESYDAKVMFLIQQANVRLNQMNSDEMKAFHQNVQDVDAAPNKEIAEINVSSYASPDGDVDLNTRLAENREGNTVKFMKKELKKANIDQDLTAEFTAEDWAGFQELVAQSDIQDKALILRVLSMYSDPAQREAEIKNMSSTFKVLAEEILPQLRYSKITATYNIIGKSDAEISELAANDADALTVEELLYAATLESDNAKKEAIYTKATRIYPNDFRAYNNIGMIQYAEGNLSEAQTWFRKAYAVAPNAPEVQMNLGLINLSGEDVAAAEAAFGKSAGVAELSEALGVLYLEKGEYAKAVDAFGDSKTNNAALAQILVQDYSKARTTLSEVAAPNATTYYLMAVVGARTNNEQMVKSNLLQAVKADSDMAKMAATDIEFAKYDVASLLN